jgi:hypothetical protein
MRICYLVLHSLIHIYIRIDSDGYPLRQKGIVMRYVALLAVLACAGVSAQEGPVTLPANYKVQFENAWVKVTAVRYEPLQKLPAHRHTPNPSAYVYLNDGPPVKFRHVGGHNVVATRAATKAGAFRVYRGLEEVHEVENTGDSPSEFLRVEVKTAVLDPETFRGKFERPSTPAAVVHLDHPQLRISRVGVKPGETVSLAASGEPALLIALQDGPSFPRGQEQWLDAGKSVELKNPMPQPIDFLRFDFKTRPAPSQSQSHGRETTAGLVGWPCP